MRLFFSILICFSLLAMVQAQTDLSPNELALQRIRASQASGRGSLSLAGLGITELPPEIGNLTKLQTLWLNHNDLVTLPPEIGNLSSLQSLILNHNQLSSLPAEIGNLGSLQELDLSYNALQGLPSSIGNLSQLSQLFLSNNQLRTLPPSLGRLTALAWLDVSNNQLGSLPSEISQLQLEHINITGNSGPLAQIANRDTREILAYAKSPLLSQLFPFLLIAGLLSVLAIPAFIFYKKQPRRRRIGKKGLRL
jgi:hypothetical protein